ncbi:MAG: hypothetical protein JST47_03185 [Bacteroidetes bacterium]|nr:hypothetical protein [Bacteroidota bacterium]MBS1973717.1 hypothetical protein [Bacteroidota bacterium]
MYRAHRVAFIFFLLLTVFGCSKELSYESSAVPSGVAATGTLKDSSGNCMAIITNGTYYNGVAILGDTSYVEVTINVATAGSYNIQSDRQNGFQFAGTGVFTNTGAQTINLKASGTPIAKGATSFILSFNGTACNFAITVQDSTGRGSNNNGSSDTSGIALNQWQFLANGHTYSGSIQSAMFTSLAGGNLLTIIGPTASGTDTVFDVNIQFSGNTIDTGTYLTSNAGTSFALQKADSLGAINVFSANATNSHNVVNLTINSYNNTSKVVFGTFSGQAWDANGVSTSVTNGKFKATVQ